jgi:hypothetical protein
VNILDVAAESALVHKVRGVSNRPAVAAVLPALGAHAVGPTTLERAVEALEVLALRAVLVPPLAIEVLVAAVP